MTAVTPQPPATATIEERLRRLEDVVEIDNLKGQYAYYSDHGFDADGFTSLFVEDGSWESNAFGSHYGIDEIRAFVEPLSGQFPWAFHDFARQTIEISADGRTATGTWYLIDFCTIADEPGIEGEPVLVTARYVDDFVRTAEGWRFKRVRIEFHQVSGWKRGWVDERFR